MTYTRARTNPPRPRYPFPAFSASLSPFRFLFRSRPGGSVSRDVCLYARARRDRRFEARETPVPPFFPPPGALCFWAAGRGRKRGCTSAAARYGSYLRRDATAIIVSARGRFRNAIRSRHASHRSPARRLFVSLSGMHAFPAARARRRRSEFRDRPRENGRALRSRPEVNVYARPHTISDNYS